MTRKEIWDKINANEADVARLKEENQKLYLQSLLLSDETQWFKEEKEMVVVKRRPKIKEEKIIGRIYWNEDFKDEDTGEVVTIERCSVVSVNGEWI